MALWGVRVWDNLARRLFDITSRPGRAANAVPFSAGQGQIPFQPSTGKTPWAWMHFPGNGDAYIYWQGGAFIWGASGADGWIIYGER